VAIIIYSMYGHIAKYGNFPGQWK
uniref:Unknown protein 1 (Fragments) n=1 Tax=Coniferiporia sulphurascens TaxID=175648 RepID=UP01_CONSH|nr:RecName: Full=Unknown protein 1 [Coniferiporia sulphurascens]